MGIFTSNIKGSEYILKLLIRENSDGKTESKREEFLAVHFDEQSRLKIRKPRTITVTLPMLQSDWEQCRVTKLFSADAPAISVGNRNPHWNREWKTYILNFSSRVKKSSVKNFQLSFEEGNNGKVI